MIIRGILDNSLNGQLCIRGFAPIKELERISQADYEYQRDLIKNRTDIEDFLETQSYLFFPEIILSYKVKYEIASGKGRGNANEYNEPLTLMQQGKKYTSKVDGTIIQVKLLSYPNLDTSGNANIKIVELYISEEEVINRPFHRVDGNHRLNAAKQSKSPKVERMVAPFCIILGTEYYLNNKLQDNKSPQEFDKAVKVFFHNINTKTIPLTSEENLKVLIDDETNFSDTDLENIFDGIYPIKTRELIKKIPIDLLKGIIHILSKNYRTYYNDIFERLLDEGDMDEEKIVDKVAESLQAVNQLYSDNSKLKSNFSYGLLTAFLWYHIKDKDKCKLFKDWILNNSIFDISEVSADSLINIFDKLCSQEIKVFVAMPYFEGNKNIIDEYNKIYGKAIKEIADKYKINISLYPIMNNSGSTIDQIQDIINKIKACKICFADITDNNANVTYEMGWARALNVKVIIVKRKGSADPKSDYRNDSYLEYDDNCRFTSLSSLIETSLKEELQKSFGLII